MTILVQIFLHSIELWKLCRKRIFTSKVRNWQKCKLINVPSGPLPFNNLSFTPAHACDPTKVRLRFVPIVEEGEARSPLPDPVKTTPDLGLLNHRLSGYGYCWCDVEAGASFARGFLLPFYVIELELKGSIGHTGMPEVMYRAEDKMVYIRRHATTQLYTETELEEMFEVVAKSC